MKLIFLGNWLTQLVVMQLVITMVITAVVYFVWRVTHPGKRW